MYKSILLITSRVFEHKWCQPQRFRNEKRLYLVTLRGVDLLAGVEYRSSCVHEWLAREQEVLHPEWSLAPVEGQALVRTRCASSACE